MKVKCFVKQTLILVSGLGVYITKFVTVHDRFSQTFEFRVGENLSMTEVMATFAKEKENLNFELDDGDVRTLVADLFGEVKTFHPRRDGKRVAVFLNISKKRPDETTNDTWKSMEISCVMNGWVLREKNVNPSSLSFSRLAGVYIDGNEVVIQLKINPLTTEFLLKSFLGNTLTHDTFGFKANETKNLPFILEYLARFSVCCGLPANDHNDSVVRKDIDEMCTQVKIGTRTAYLSRKCHQVVPSLGETCFSVFLPSAAILNVDFSSYLIYVKRGDLKNYHSQEAPVNQQFGNLRV